MGDCPVGRPLVDRVGLLGQGRASLDSGRASGAQPSCGRQPFGNRHSGGTQAPGSSRPERGPFAHALDPQDLGGRGATSPSGGEPRVVGAACAGFAFAGDGLSRLAGQWRDDPARHARGRRSEPRDDHSEQSGADPGSLRGGAAHPLAE